VSAEKMSSSHLDGQTQMAQYH